ncbi:hypothetical protein NE237_024281 [Protea cynaroides]|uniref:Uncharacterized protein n=1 Tax=Protea cynaroides TaxID=273540 RepID=A0A9Q0HDF1_9MAGN|nr:hypothetical protein NE237_024281 [Protea cynaroides]
MSHSLLIPSPSSLITYRSSPPRQLNFSQSELMNPPPLLRSPISVIRTEVVAQQSNPINSGIFGPKKELTGIQLLAEALSPWPRVRLASSVAMVAGALAGGYEVGSTLNFVSGAVAPGAAGGLVIRKLNSCVSEVAAVNLHNFVASSDDPESLKREDIEAIAKKFVFSVFPPRFENLKGNQREIVMKFKNALGILDLDAAVEEIVIKKQYFRQCMLELDDGDAGIEQCRDTSIEQCRVVRDAIAIASGVHGYERDIKAFVKIVAAQDPNRDDLDPAAHGSRLTEEAAIAIAIKRVLLDISWILYL